MYAVRSWLLQLPGMQTLVTLLYYVTEIFISIFICAACNCDAVGSDSFSCDQETGNCTCKVMYASARCDQCQDGYFDYPNCQCISSCNRILTIYYREYFQTATVTLRALRKEFVIKQPVTVFVRKGTVVKSAICVSQASLIQYHHYPNTSDILIFFYCRILWIS